MAGYAVFDSIKRKGLFMRIVNLIENTRGNNNCCLFEHGLSFYIETKKHKLLVDTGASNAFLENAKKLHVDLSQVDLVILSHGHYDHSGGILGFAEQNSKAQIWMQSLAVEEYYHKGNHKEKYIGIDPEIKTLSQVKMIDGNKRIDKELFLFCGVLGRRLWPSGNLELKVKKGSDFYQDQFLHEQYLVIEEGSKNVLISGCAHNGILNILDRYREIYGKNPNVVFSGFHMRRKSDYSEEDFEIIRQTATELKKMDTIFYTGHCTGEVPFQILKELMGEQLFYIHSGDEVQID